MLGSAGAGSVEGFRPAFAAADDVAAFRLEVVRGVKTGVFGVGSSSASRDAAFDFERVAMAEVSVSRIGRLMRILPRVGAEAGISASGGESAALRGCSSGGLHTGTAAQARSSGFRRGGRLTS